MQLHASTQPTQIPCPCWRDSDSSGLGLDLADESGRIRGLAGREPSEEATNYLVARATYVPIVIEAGENGPGSAPGARIFV